jgi:hypothetical protein
VEDSPEIEVDPQSGVAGQQAFTIKEDDNLGGGMLQICGPVGVGCLDPFEFSGEDSYTPMVPENYTAPLCVDDDGGCWASDTVAFSATAAAPPAAPSLSCSPSTVTRGDTVTCTVSNTAAGNITSWQFDGGNATVIGPSKTLTWSGPMVVSGTVTVRVNSLSFMAQSDITVNPRSWHIDPANPTQVQGNTLADASGTTVLTLAVPPLVPPDLGYSYWVETPLQYTWTTLSAGPNAGFTYYSSPLTFGNFWFHYVVNTDLANKSSVFSLHQCGATGFISWSDLYAQTQRHEYNSAAQSHWAFYMISWNNNNPGDYYEASVALPNADVAQFNTVSTNAIQDLIALINMNGSLEPYAVNKSEAGIFLGNINFGPNYATCGN